MMCPWRVLEPPELFYVGMYYVLIAQTIHHCLLLCCCAHRSVAAGSAELE